MVRVDFVPYLAKLIIFASITLLADVGHCAGGVIDNNNINFSAISQTDKGKKNWDDKGLERLHQPFGAQEVLHNPTPSVDPYIALSYVNRSVVSIHSLQRFVNISKWASRTLQWQDDSVVSLAKLRGRHSPVFPAVFPNEKSGETEAPIGIGQAEWNRRRRMENRRLRLSTFFVPAPSIYVCTAVDQLVASYKVFSSSAATLCRDYELLKPSTLSTFKKAYLPSLEKWITKNLLKLETEPYVPLYVNTSLGKCTGMVPLIPLDHRNNKPVSFTSLAGSSYSSASAKRRLGGVFSPSGLQYSLIPNREGKIVENPSYVAATSTTPSSRPSASHVSPSTGGHPPDIIIYVTTMYTRELFSGHVCQRHPISNRPTVIHLNVNPRSMSLWMAGTALQNTLVDSQINSELFFTLIQTVALNEQLYMMSPTPMMAPAKNLTEVLLHPKVEELGSGATRLDLLRMQQKDVFESNNKKASAGYTHSILVHPAVRAWAQHRYQCPNARFNDATVGVFNRSNVTNSNITVPSGNSSLTTPLGAESYHNLLDGETNMYLDPRLFGLDVLSLTYSTPKITNVSLVIIESTGWLNVDHWSITEVQFNPFGFGSGCSFQSKKCNQQDYLLPPRATSSNEYPYYFWRYPGSQADVKSQAPGVVKEVHFNDTEEYITLEASRPDLNSPLARIQEILKGTKYSNASVLQSTFCFTPAEKRCHVTRKFYAECLVAQYSNIPEEYHYYPDNPSVGGDVGFDYCPTYLNRPVYCNPITGDVGSVEDDMFCFDSVIEDTYEVSIGGDPVFYDHFAQTPSPRGGETGRTIPLVAVSVPVLKTSQSPKCFKVVDCDVGASTYSVYASETINGSLRWEFAGQCQQVSIHDGVYEVSPQVFEYRRMSTQFACVPFEVVCGNARQESPAMFPPTQSYSSQPPSRADSIVGKDGSWIIHDVSETASFEALNFTFVPYPHLFNQRPLLGLSTIESMARAFLTPQNNGVVEIDKWRTMAQVEYVVEGSMVEPSYQLRNVSYIINVKPKLRASVRFGALVVFTLPAGGSLHCAEKLPSLEDFRLNITELQTLQHDRSETTRPHDPGDSSASYWTKVFSLQNRTNESESETIALVALPLFSGNDDAPNGDLTDLDKTVNALVNLVSPLFQCDWKTTAAADAAFFGGDPGAFDEVSVYSLFPSFSSFDTQSGLHSDALSLLTLERLRKVLGDTGVTGGPLASSLEQVNLHVSANMSLEYTASLLSSPLGDRDLASRRSTMFTPMRIAFVRDINFEFDDIIPFCGQLSNPNGESLLRTRILDFSYSSPTKFLFPTRLQEQLSRPVAPEIGRWGSNADILFTSAAYLPQAVNVTAKNRQSLEEYTTTFLVEIEVLDDPSTAAKEATVLLTIALPASIPNSPEADPTFDQLFDSGVVSLAMDSLQDSLFNASSPPTVAEVNQDERFASLYVPVRVDAISPAIVASPWHLQAWEEYFGANSSSSPLNSATDNIQRKFHQQSHVSSTGLSVTGLNCTMIVLKDDQATPLLLNLSIVEGLSAEALFVDNFIGRGEKAVWRRWSSPSSSDRVHYESLLMNFNLRTSYLGFDIITKQSHNAMSAGVSSRLALVNSSSHLGIGLIGCRGYQFVVDGISFHKVAPKHRMTSLETIKKFAPSVPPLRAVGALFGNDPAARLDNLNFTTSVTFSRRVFLGNIFGSPPAGYMPSSGTYIYEASSSVRLFPTLQDDETNPILGIFHATGLVVMGEAYNWGIYLEVRIPYLRGAMGALYGQKHNLPAESSIMPLSTDATMVNKGIPRRSSGSDGTHAGIRIGDQITIQFNNTQYDWRYEVQHPWPNASNVFLKCEPGVTVTTRATWSYQQVIIHVLDIERRPLRSNISKIFTPDVLDAEREGINFETLMSRIPFSHSNSHEIFPESPSCRTSPGTLLGLQLKGFLSVNFEVILYFLSVEYKSSVGVVDVSTGKRKANGDVLPTSIITTSQYQWPDQYGLYLDVSTQKCNFRGTRETSKCSCVNGYGGPHCEICEAPVDGSSTFFYNSSCDHSCLELSLPWAANCSLVGGVLNPQDGCFCHCRGVRCFRPYTTPTATHTQTPTATVRSTQTPDESQTQTLPPFATPLHTPSQSTTLQPTRSREKSQSQESGRVLLVDITISLSPSQLSPGTLEGQKHPFQTEVINDEVGRTEISQVEMLEGITLEIGLNLTKRYVNVESFANGEKVVVAWSSGVCGSGSKRKTVLNRFALLMNAAGSPATVKNISCSDDGERLFLRVSPLEWIHDAVAGGQFAFIRLFPLGSSSIQQSQNRTLQSLFAGAEEPLADSCPLCATVVGTLEDTLVNELGQYPSYVTVDTASGLLEESAGINAVLRGALGLVVNIRQSQRSAVAEVKMPAIASGLTTFHRVAGFIGFIVAVLSNPWQVVLDVQLAGLVALYSVRANSVCVWGDLESVAHAQTEFDVRVQSIKGQIRPYGPLSVEEARTLITSLGPRPEPPYTAHDKRGVLSRGTSLFEVASPLSVGFLADWQLMFFVKPKGINEETAYWKESGTYELFYSSLSLWFMGVASAVALALAIFVKVDLRRATPWNHVLRAVAPFSSVMPVMLCCLFGQNMFRAGEALAAVFQPTETATSLLEAPSSPIKPSTAATAGVTFTLATLALGLHYLLWYRSRDAVSNRLKYVPYRCILASSVGQGPFFWVLGKGAFLRNRAARNVLLCGGRQEQPAERNNSVEELFLDEEGLQECAGSSDRAEAKVMFGHLMDILEVDRSSTSSDTELDERSPHERKRTSTSSSVKRSENLTSRVALKYCSADLLRAITYAYISCLPPNLLPLGYWDTAAVERLPSPNSSKGSRELALAICNAKPIFVWQTHGWVGERVTSEGSGESEYRLVEDSGLPGTPRHPTNRIANSNEPPQQQNNDLFDFIGASALTRATRNTPAQDASRPHTPTSSLSSSHRKPQLTSNTSFAVSVPNLSSTASTQYPQQEMKHHHHHNQRETTGSPPSINGNLSQLKAVARSLSPANMSALLVLRNGFVALMLGLSGRYQLCNSPRGDQPLERMIHSDTSAVVSAMTAVILIGAVALNVSTFTNPLQKIILFLTTISVPVYTLLLFYADTIITQQDSLIVGADGITNHNGHGTVHTSLLTVATVVLVLYDTIVYLVCIPLLGVTVFIVEPALLRSVEHALIICKTATSTDNRRQKKCEMLSRRTHPSATPERGLQPEDADRINVHQLAL